MFQNAFQARLRILALLAATFALALFAGCGDDDEGDDSASSDDTAAAEAQPVEIGLQDLGGSASFTAPKKIEAGLSEITFTNDSKKPSDFQLIYVEGDHSEGEVVKAFEETGSAKPLPDWFIAGGGVGPSAPGQSRSVTQVLEPGTYYGFDTEGAKDAYTIIEVSGEATDAELPEVEAKVTASEYTFEVEGLTAGNNKLVFENIGAQPHHIVAAPIIGDATIEDVEKFFQTEKGKPPVSFEETLSTAVIDTQDSQVTDLDLEAGRYAFVCFISDRQGGPPHVAKGMIKEVEVK